MKKVTFSSICSSHHLCVNLESAGRFATLYLSLLLSEKYMLKKIINLLILLAKKNKEIRFCSCSHVLIISYVCDMTSLGMSDERCKKSDLVQ